MTAVGFRSTWEQVFAGAIMVPFIFDKGIYELNNPSFVVFGKLRHGGGVRAGTLGNQRRNLRVYDLRILR